MVITVRLILQPGSAASAWVPLSFEGLDVKSDLTWCLFFGQRPRQQQRTFGFWLSLATEPLSGAPAPAVAARSGRKVHQVIRSSRREALRAAMLLPARGPA